MKYKYSIFIVINLFLYGCGIEMFDKNSVKWNFDILITNASIVTMDKNSRIIENGFIGIKDSKIIALDSMDDLENNSYKAKENLNAKGAWIIPGLVNAHTHLAMTLLRGLGDDLELNEWLEKYIFPTEAKFLNQEYVAVGTRLGLSEMIRGGITTYADMYYFEDIVADETKKAGMRGVLGQTLLDFPPPDHKTWDNSINYTIAFINKWKSDETITPALAPHAIYTVGTEHWEVIENISKEHNVPILTHLAEAPAETSYSLKQYKNRPIAYMNSINLLHERLTAAHVIQINSNEMQILKEKQVGIVHCPQSNMKLVSGVAKIPEMLKAQVRVGLGTDGAASNNDLNLWEEMDTAAKLHKLYSNDPTVVSAKQVLEMATIGGAKALHMEEKIGSLEAGKYADLIVIDMNRPHLTPIYNIYSHLIYATKASDVNDVMVNGKWIMKNKQLLTIDENKAIQDAKSIQAKIKSDIY
jgi:5-methylthioadenosine/S-adenosylhomocysteine deaminase